MADPGIADVLKRPPLKEAPKMATKSVTKEKQSVQPKPTRPPGEAHKKLVDIAGGKPLADVFAPPVESIPLPDREPVSQVLSEANSLLLDARDARILVTALATQAQDSPMGNEMRMDTLRMIGKMSNENLSPEAVIRLDTLQKKIQSLNIPDVKPDQSQLYQTIQKYNETHPEKAIPTEVVEQIKNGQLEAAPTVAKLLQTNTELAAEVWKGITGMDNFTGLVNPTPDQILALTEMDATAQNQKKMSEIFGKIKARKEPIDVMSKIFPSLMIGALGIMFITQLTGSEQQGAAH